MGAGSYNTGLSVSGTAPAGTGFACYNKVLRYKPIQWLTALRATSLSGRAINPVRDSETL